MANGEASTIAATSRPVLDSLIADLRNQALSGDVVLGCRRSGARAQVVGGTARRRARQAAPLARLARSLFQPSHRTTKRPGQRRTWSA
ncbi:MAG: hypothetical protein R2706_06185 [Acidimicrobiales bacterium]